MNDFNKKLSEALMRVAELDGVYPENEEIGIRGKYVNDYLLVFFLAQLIQDGDVETKINIEIRYVVAQDVQMGDIDYRCNRTQHKNIRDVCAWFLRVLHSI